MRKVTPLTDTKIRTSKAKDKEYTLADGNGLQVLIKPNGTKLWQFVFKSPTLQKRRKTTLGNYPIPTSLKAAREKRKEYLDLLIEGIDPIDYTRNEKEKVTIDKDGMFKSVMNEWLEKESRNTVTATHDTKVRMLTNDVLPYLKKKHIKDVNIDDIILIVSTKEKKAPEMASRIYSNLDNLFRYAVLRRYCDRNLLADIRKSDVIRTRVAKNMPKITDEENLKELVNAIYNYDKAYALKNVLKLVLHLPLRPDNLCNLKWKYIDYDEKTLTIPRAEMKIKNINLNDFILPLTQEVIEILKEQEAIQTEYSTLKEYVFLGVDHKNPVNKESGNRALDRLGFNDESKGRRIRLHGFRVTFRSMIDTLDRDNIFSYEAKERALDHHDKNLSSRAYNHKANYLEHLRPLMKYWSDYITSLH